MNEMLKKKDVARLLKISIHTLDIWVMKKKIPFIKLGQAKPSPVRFELPVIEAWIREHKR
jgi:hypothetical protein